VTEFSEAATTMLVQDRAVALFEGFYDGLGDKLPCEYCGQWDYLERHHRQFRSRGGDWRASNIILLCGHCHHLATVCANGWAREDGLWVSQWAKSEDVPVRVWYADGFVLLDNDGGYVPIAA
jgi:hypothetical protein